MSEQPARKRRMTPKGAASYKRILDAAQTLFAQSGYNGTSLDSVAREAGLTLAGLVHYFPSKQALLLAVLERRDEGDISSVEGLSGPDAFATMRDNIRANEHKRELVRLFTMVVAEGLDDKHPAHEYAIERYERVLPAMRSALERGVRDGSYRPDIDVDAVATWAVAMADGLQTLWLIDESVPMSTLFDKFLDVIEGLIASDSSERPNSERKP